MVERSLSAAAIVRQGWVGVNGVWAHPVNRIFTLRQISVGLCALLIREPLCRPIMNNSIPAANGGIPRLS